jgi:hypothetical protein
MTLQTAIRYSCIVLAIALFGALIIWRRNEVKSRY